MTSNIVRIFDYQRPTHTIESVYLDVTIGDQIEVISRLKVQSNGGADWELNREFFETLALNVDGQPWQDLSEKAHSVILHNLPDRFEFSAHTRFDPAANTHLSGIYLSDGIICSQCEAEGFRRITYFPDRPDVMSLFTVKITADQTRYPLLLSNGEEIAHETHADGTHSTTWHDPFPKPCYLFALVAGDLGVIERPYQTADGKDVRLRIFSEHKNIEQCHFALDCLEKAMRWDERRFGLNYDLSDFMVVAVDAFNFGAMENKGLNVFNSALLLADPETASDMDMQRVDAVVAHEYFHNWSGNRVTCRDWFQISLKEGLTVYREQEYMADHYDRATARVEDIKLLRQQQFPEDDGPMAHPVRPSEYSKIDNFYSATVYEKGAEVIRMMESLIGREAFDRGIALYFERHDGQAVTCDDFVQAMQDASNVNLDTFKRWYSQAGRPRVTLDFSYDAQTKQLHIDYQQRIDNQPYPDPLTLPCKVALLDATGTELIQNQHDTMLVMDQFEGRLTLSDVPSEPTVLPFVALSAPVSVQQSQSNRSLALAFGAAPDGYSRYEAAQQLIQRAYWQDDQDAQSNYLDTISSLLDQPLSPRLLAMLLAFPSFDEVKSGHAQIDVDQFCDFKQQINNAIGEQNSAALLTMFESLHQRTRNSGYEAASERMLLTQLMRLMPKEQAYASALKLYDTANNLSERTAALQWLCANADNDDINRRLDDAYQRWSHHSVALDHWFRAQVSGDGEYNRNRFTTLLSHPDYTHKIPNRVRSLMAAFMVGSVTTMLRSTDLHPRLFSETLKVDGINPMMGARLGGLLNRWKDYSGRIGDSLHAELEALSKQEISDTLREIVGKSLV